MSNEHPQYNVQMLSWEDLTEEEQAMYEGGDADMSHYLRATHNGEWVFTESDEMEPEDVTFYRDLSWIEGALKDAYRRGREDGSTNTAQSRALEAAREALEWFVARESPIRSKFELHGPQDTAAAMAAAFAEAAKALAQIEAVKEKGYE